MEFCKNADHGITCIGYNNKPSCRQCGEEVAIEHVKLRTKLERLRSLRQGINRLIREFPDKTIESWDVYLVEQCEKITHKTESSYSPSARLL